MNDSPFSTVEDAGLSTRLTPRKTFRFEVCNDFAGRFSGTIEAESEEQVRQYLTTGLLRGIRIQAVAGSES